MKQLLCYGDSNTWGLIPGTQTRFPWGVRWTSRLQERLAAREVRVIEEGLCGRTTIFEDAYRPDRNGLRTLPLILETHRPLDTAILMLGTNDCKSFYKLNARQIAMGVGQCVDALLTALPADRILLLSPICLGEKVWMPDFDPEFDRDSVRVSHELKASYREIALRKGVHFLAASDFAAPSDEDQEHMDAETHAAFADALCGFLAEKGWLD